MRKWLKWIGGGLLLGAVALQFTSPAHVNPPVAPGHDLLASNGPPPEVAALLKNSCYDCHSSETKWPWYSYVAPMSWVLVQHVNDARYSLNFSDWPHDSPRRARKKWERIADAVDANEMPLPSYLWIHSGSRLTPQQRKQLVDWAQQEAQALKAQ
ncbi:MAG TPA: heme-binding domain-containing protein [Candidatus Baltobacteraceae bacterium]|jgi:hypothetical protein|nr:heme-binding domain-containing protein [Candidatus Baltobacteraceae bacterium]